MKIDLSLRYLSLSLGKSVTSLCVTLPLMGSCRVSPDLRSTICCGMVMIK